MPTPAPPDARAAEPTRSGERLFVVVAAACCLALAAGAVRLFQTRIADGRAYPPYTSLRHDPLGTSVLYESFARLPGWRVERNLRPLDEWFGAPGTAVILAGAGPLPDGGTLADLRRLAAGGTRVVIAFAAPASGVMLPRIVPLADAAEKPSDPLPRLQAFSGGATAFAHATREGNDPALPATVPWRGAWYFEAPAPAWRILYRLDGRPVLIDRAYGRGRIVLAADAFFLSNEALWGDRATGLLAWLPGSARHVVFDETHRGLVEPGGLVSLMRRYRTQGFGLGALLLAAFFLWRATPRFVPAPPQPPAGRRLAGRAAATGLAGLLGRHVRPADALAESVAIGLRHAGPRAAACREAVEAIRRDTADPVEAYRRIARTLHPEKGEP